MYLPPKTCICHQRRAFLAFATKDVHFWHFATKDVLLPPKTCFCHQRRAFDPCFGPVHLTRAVVDSPVQSWIHPWIHPWFHPCITRGFTRGFTRGLVPFDPWCAVPVVCCTRVLHVAWPVSVCGMAILKMDPKIVHRDHFAHGPTCTPAGTTSLGATASKRVSEGCIYLPECGKIRKFGGFAHSFGPNAKVCARGAHVGVRNVTFPCTIRGPF